MYRRTEQALGRPDLIIERYISSLIRSLSIIRSSANVKCTNAGYPSNKKWLSNSTKISPYLNNLKRGI